MAQTQDILDAMTLEVTLHYRPVIAKGRVSWRLGRGWGATPKFGGFPDLRLTCCPGNLLQSLHRAKEQVNLDAGGRVSGTETLGKLRRSTQISSECVDTINSNGCLGCPQPQTWARYFAPCH